MTPRGAPARSDRRRRGAAGSPARSGRGAPVRRSRKSCPSGSSGSTRSTPTLPARRPSALGARARLEVGQPGLGRALQERREEAAGDLRHGPPERLCRRTRPGSRRGRRAGRPGGSCPRRRPTSSPCRTGSKGISSTSAPSPRAMAAAATSACWQAIPPCFTGKPPASPTAQTSGAPVHRRRPAPSARTPARPRAAPRSPARAASGGRSRDPPASGSAPAISSRPQRQSRTTEPRADLDPGLPQGLRDLRARLGPEEREGRPLGGHDRDPPRVRGGRAQPSRRASGARARRPAAAIRSPPGPRRPGPSARRGRPSRPSRR